MADIAMFPLPFLIAILAPTVNCIQLVPQLLKTWRTKRVKDLSFVSICLFLTTNILWLTHGYFIMDISLVVAGVISVIINGTLLALYLRYR
jgi:MtN3 and saliva related transmembrane protein